MVGLLITLNAVILYFSQTSNTRKYSEKIAEGIEQKGSKCELVRLRKKDKDIDFLKKFDFSRFDLIGIGTPVYYFHPPYHLFDILDVLPSLEGKLGFLFCTSGGNPGSTLYQIKEVVNAKGLKIIDGNDSFIGLDRHPLYRDFGGVYPPSVGHPTDEELENAKKWGMQLIDKASDPSTPEKDDFRKKNSFYAEVQTFEFINKTYPKFKVNEEKCTQCGTCEKICPVDCIVLDSFPKWTKKCDRCYLCEMLCPENAIECDWNWQASHMTELMKKKGFSPENK
ncbi:MAG: EFR1 family ferrodoxin [Candidatus Helarchaeota archaeon]